MPPQTVRVISGHRVGQLGLATERTINGYWVRFYAVHDPKTTHEAEIIQSLHKGHAASVMKLHARLNLIFSNVKYLGKIKMTFEVTLKQLRDADACIEGYNKLVCHLSGKPFDAEKETHIRFAHKESISILTILESNGLDDALWALRCLENHDRDLRLFAVWCARKVEHLNTDDRVKNCNDVAEKFANGVATDKELEAARAAAWAAARAAAGAAWAAAEAAWAVAGEAAREAARAAAGAAWAAAEAAGAAAWAVAGEAAREAWAAAGESARADQSEMLAKMCNGDAPWQSGIDYEAARASELNFNET